MQAIAHLHLIIFTTVILVENYVEERNVLPLFYSFRSKHYPHLYEGCPESISPFWIFREPVAWPWCNLAASQRSPYCASVNSHSPMGLVSRQWDGVDWACVLCDGRIHKSPPFRRRFYLWEKPEVAGSQIWAGGGLTDLGDVMLCQEKPAWEMKNGQAHCLICSLGHCECDGHTVHKLSQRRLTADWLAPRESDCSRMHSKVSSDWLSSYVKATRPVLEIFKMDRYFPDSPRKCHIERIRL